MMEYKLNLADFQNEIPEYGKLKISANNPKNEKIEANSFYLELNNIPFMPIAGEFHFSRYPYRYWEEELLKMKMGGINTVTSYILWIHHEEKEGIFSWENDNNIRYFVDLCAKHKLYVMLRIGPFAHAECRNGGLPDWLYQRPFDVRSNDPEYLFYVKRLYDELGRQVRGQMYQDGGPVIAIQLENEFMHCGAPWETTYKQITEYLTAGSGNKAHMEILRSFAREAGLDTGFFTGTGWGGADGSPLIDYEMLPMRGEYAFTPWSPNEDYVQPPTKSYVYRDFHNKDFCYPGRGKTYNPNEYPVGFCELGGGIQITYFHRPIVPPESVDCLTNIMLGSGTNILGYYMYHGGSNPILTCSFSNEFTIPRISYDFQAPIREFGQIADSYKHLKLLFMFAKEFSGELLPAKTIIPEGGSDIKPEDTRTLRYAVRMNNKSGFVFFNSYQDHVSMNDIEGINLSLQLKDESISFPKFTLKKNTCPILPFNLSLHGIDLKYATAMPLTRINDDYIFCELEGMTAEYGFSDKVIKNEKIISLKNSSGKEFKLITLTKKQALNLWKTNDFGLILTEANIIERDGFFELLTTETENISLSLYPPKKITGIDVMEKPETLFSNYEISIPKKAIDMEITQISDGRVKIDFSIPDGINDVFLHVDYVGDIGNAYIGSRLISDNFYNNTTWEIGLKRFMPEIIEQGLYIHIDPLYKGKKVYNEVEAAFKQEFSGDKIAKIISIKAVCEYKLILN